MSQLRSRCVRCAGVSPPDRGGPWRGRLAIGILACLGAWVPALSAPVLAPGGPPEPPANEAALDAAVDTSGGAWCSDPAELPADGVGLTLEGWVRPESEPGAVAELSASAGAVALVLDRESHLRIETAGDSRALGLRLGRQLWTYYRMTLEAGRAQVEVWNALTGDRSATAPMRIPPLSRGFTVCVGGRQGGQGSLRGWADEVRLWEGRVDGGVARHWRHRRLSDRHPLSRRLLAVWPFSKGQGESEPGLGRLGPLHAREGRWVTLPSLSYGPTLRAARPESVAVIFGARWKDGARGTWRGAVEIWPAADESQARTTAESPATEDADYVAHVVADGLSSQTRYAYAPLIDGRRAIDGDEALPSFRTPPDSSLGFDFVTAFLADQHPPDGPNPTPLPAYGAAMRSGALFWCQLGDVMSGSVNGVPEERRTAEGLRALWERNFGTWATPQADVVRSVPLNVATISDHEIADNYSMNWHHQAFRGVPGESATLGDRIAQYDLSIGSWWNHFGWGERFDDALGSAARRDLGQSAMGRTYRHPGLYHSYRPTPFVEFFVIDTTSYRGDPHEERRRYAQESNRDTDHSRYPWARGGGETYIFGDREHGATPQTDRVRSWLGPAQKAAFLDALRGSPARVIVVAAGYPLYGLKFETSELYWPARESGFDFATEAAEILDALAVLDRLVLWVHGDAHSPALARLRPNVYQLQVGATTLSGEGTGHHARSLAAGSRSQGDLLGGGNLLAGHRPELAAGGEEPSLFRGGLDQFEGFLRLYFHPGREVLRSSEAGRLARGSSPHEVVLVAPSDPARGRARDLVVGKVARVVVAGEAFFSQVRGYGYGDGRVVFRLADPVVSADPEEFRILIEDEAWVRADWFDGRGKPWAEFSAVLRAER